MRQEQNWENNRARDAGVTDDAGIDEGPGKKEDKNPQILREMQNIVDRENHTSSCDIEHKAQLFSLIAEPNPKYCENGLHFDRLLCASCNRTFTNLATDAGNGGQRFKPSSKAPIWGCQERQKGCKFCIVQPLLQGGNR